MEKSILENSKITVCYTNAHIIRLSISDSKIQSLINRFDINYVDGFGVRLASKILTDVVLNRFTLTEHAYEVLRICERNGWRIFFLGGEQKYIQPVKTELKKTYPNLKLVGFLNGFDQLNDTSIEIINSSFADILWLGLGTPRQELWVQTNIDKLNIKIVNCVGDLFTALAGKRLRGPKLLRDNGFEWLFRLVQHPIKYFDRYFIGIPYFFYLIFKYKLKHLKDN